MKRLAVITPLVVFVALGLVLAFSTGRDPSIAPSALIGKPLPEFVIWNKTKSGMHSDELHLGPGQKPDVTLVNFFATWCVPCVAEHPVLMALKEKGVTISGILYRDDLEKADEWLEQRGNPYLRTGSDDQGIAATAFAISGIPETFVIDPDGIIRYRHAGPLTQDVVDREILPLVKALRR
ncbi:MAG: DsbE family thiol:disulfide interchange protein [Pseudomonadota bacterium]|nr:DsbE family thiol:disulfide interchange protein [Pseudomonadota bacterium]